MSGICSVWRKENPGQLSRTLAAVATGLMLQPAERVSRLEDEGAGTGTSAGFETQQIFRTANTLVSCDARLENQDDLVRLAGLDRDIPAEQRTAALLAALYEKLGAGFVERLEGVFSLVLWDRREQRMLAAVDRFGVNRLVYFTSGKVAIVATRLDALMKSGEADAAINPRAIANLVNFSANLGPDTIHKAVQRLLPGHRLLISRGRTEAAPYWDMKYGVGGERSEKRLSSQLESLVQRAVERNCEGDDYSRLGSFLSGGTDSSTVTGMMGRLGKGSPQAFSIGFQEQPFNELEYAEIAARKFQARHFTYLVGPEDCFEALPEMVRSFDEPFGNSSAIPTYFCAKLAKENGVSALLAGDGGDELFGGNERYATDKIFQIYSRAPKLLRAGLIEPLVGLTPAIGPFRRAHGYIRRAKMPAVDRFMSFQFLVTHRAEEVFAPDFVSELNGYTVVDVPRRYYAGAPAREDLDRLLYLDVKVTLGDSDLPKVTSMCELAGIQARFPFLDRAVAEFSGTIPANLKVKGFEKRYLFKRAFRNLLPPEILVKKKHGFGIPVAPWMKTYPKLRELARDTLLSPRAFERGYFRRQFIEDLFRKHEADESTFYGDILWTFLVLELWHRQFVDQPVAV